MIDGGKGGGEKGGIRLGRVVVVGVMATKSGREGGGGAGWW